jgi:hypothetical protein
LRGAQYGPGEFREYPLVKLYYEGKLARIEALRKKRAEKLKQ